jgi:hypothetical protein
MIIVSDAKLVWKKKKRKKGCGVKVGDDSEEDYEGEGAEPYFYPSLLIRCWLIQIIAQLILYDQMPTRKTARCLLICRIDCETGGYLIVCVHR